MLRQTDILATRIHFMFVQKPKKGESGAGTVLRWTKESRERGQLIKIFLIFKDAKTFLIYYDS